MRNVSIMLKPSSSLCNMRCRYCFYADVADNRDIKIYGFMSLKTAEKIIDNVFADLNKGDNLTIAFQGGEPTLIGLDFYREFVRMVNEKNKGINISYAFQSNGYLIDEQWCQFFVENDVLVGISFDLLMDVHNVNRIDGRKEATGKRIMNAIRLCSQYKVKYNILTVLTASLARHPDRVYREIKKNGFEYVQFIPCLGELNEEKRTVYEITPELFAQFYSRIFKLWYEDLMKGQYVSIKLFDDIINMLSVGAVTGCGMNGQCANQIIVEADGSIYPCDFYVLDEYRAGYLTEHTLDYFINSETGKRFTQEQTDKHNCLMCQYSQICNGNCKRMRSNICFSENESFCGYRKFLDENINSLIMISRLQQL